MERDRMFGKLTTLMESDTAEHAGISHLGGRKEREKNYNWT